jgi:hypothetical protein
MLARLRPRSAYDVMAALALFLVLAGGSAYAANTVFTTDIVDGEVKAADLGGAAVTNSKLGPNSVGSGKIIDGDVTNADLAAGAVTSANVVDDSLSGLDVASSTLTGSDVANGSLTTSDIADDSLTATDIAGANRSGSISVGAISNARCVTVTGGVTGAQPGDVAVLTINGSLASGILIYAQRALTDQVDIKVCNLSGATSAAITDLPVHVMTFR